MSLRSASHTTGRRIAGRAQDDRNIDPYAHAAKHREPTACPECGAVYHRGRWQWGKAPVDATPLPCPACRRIADRLPAGVVTLHGPLPLDRKTEILQLFRHQEAAEKAEHPLGRIMGIAETDETVTVQTTDIHLPRRLGAALKHAHHGELTVDFDETGYFVRVDWHPSR